MDIFTVSEYNALVKSTIDREFLLKNAFVTGAISNLKKHSNGCYYFSLKDETASIDVTIFSNNLRAKVVGKNLENGLVVTLRGSLNFYEKMGRLSFICQDIIIGQKSSFQIAYEELKKELTALGYFDESHKQALPLMPTCIGLVTSESGAVLHDILHVTKKRNPFVQFKLFSVPVQGDNAPPYIARGIQRADADPEVELIIVGRGGGSMEDLWCFNDRRVVEAIYYAKTPLVSAIGHETDYTLADFAADARGATPSHAAELTIYPLEKLKEALVMKEAYLHGKIEQELQRKRQKLSTLCNQHLAIPALQLLAKEKQKIKRMESSLENSTKKGILEKKQTLALLGQRLELLNPLTIFTKGYSKAEVKGCTLRSVGQTKIGDTLTLQLSDGVIHSEIKEINHHGK